MRRSSKAIAAVFSATAVVAGALSPYTAKAQVVWQGPAGSAGSPGAPADFGVGSNWVGGNVPNNVVGDINNGGTATISGNENFTVTELWVGNNDGGTAQYGNVIQTGGTLTASNWLDVGRFGSTGDYNLAGGVVSQINGGDQIQIFGNNSATAPNATMEIGAGATLNVGGVLSIGESNGTVGWGNAAVTVNGGAINSGQIYIGDDGQGDNVAGGGGTGTLTLNSGTITSNNWVVIGRAGYSTGTLNMNGGTFIYTGQYGNFEVGGYQSNNIATLNLNAGLLQTNNIRTEDNGGSQTINFNGGTLQTNDNDSGFIGGHGTFTALNVQNGGAVIDTNGYNIGISEGLSHGTGTNPTDGGLTKIGAGTLTLSASNTYNGPTTINAGTLVVTGSLASAITVKSGATLNILGSTTSNVTVNSGGTVGSYSATGAGGSVMGSLTFTGSTILVVNPSGSQFMTVGGAVDGSSGTVLVSPVITTAPTGVAEEVLYAKGGILGSVGTNFKPTIRGTLSEASDASGVGTDLILTSSGAANLVWQGTSATNPSYWDIQTTPNWLNTGTGQTDVFYNSDNVTFDDTGATTSIAIQGIAVFPGSVTFNNSTAKSYTFSGGAIAGGGSLSILGGGMVTLNQSNSYTGATNINNGTLAVGASGSLSASTPVNLGSGASNGVLRLGDSTGAISVTVAALNVVGTGTGNELLGGNSNTSTLAVSSSILVGTPTTPTAVLTIGAGANLYGNTGGNPSIGIGPAAGLTGTVNVLTGGTLTSDSADIWIGNGSGGVGTLDISGGTVVSNGWIAPGRAGGTGTINLTGGSLIKAGSNGNLDLGGDGGASQGYLIQTGGNVTTSTFVVLGENSAQDVGVWNMSGGSSTATVSSIIIGSSGNGTVNISAGAQMNATGGTIVGQNGSAVGLLNITNALDTTGGLTANYSALVNVNAGGVLNVTAGSPSTEIGNGAGTNATLNVFAGGTFNGGNAEVHVGDNSGLAVMNVSGAVVVDNYFAVGRIGGTGTLNLSGSGSITVMNGSNGLTIVGGDGGGNGSVGYFYQTGGTFNSPTNGLELGEQNGTKLDSGIWNFSGGTANLASTSSSITGLTIGGSGNGTVNLSGTAQLSSGNVIIANAAGSSGVLNISGGTSNVRSIDVGLGGAGTVNFTGGQLTSTSVTLGSSSTATSALNLSGGAVLTTTGITSGNASTAPVFNINGATIQALNNTTTLISLPSNQPVQIGSLGATIDSQAFNVGIQATLAGSGGLTKVGAGNLRLSASNSYLGNTTVSAGTLTVANPNALSNGSVLLGNHATLALAAASSAIQFTNYNLNAQTNVFTPVVAASQTAVTLTTTTGSNATSIFDGNNFVSINDATGFAASFTYNHATSGPEETGADGVVFVLQSGNGSPSVAGGAGGSLAYNGSPGFGSSLAAGIDLFLDRLDTGAGNGSNGVLTNVPAENAYPLVSQTTSANVTIVYNGAAQTLTETFTSLANGSSMSITTPNVDASALLGGSPGGTANAYIGFTAATGGVDDVQTISDFKFNPTGTTIPANNSAAIAISNAVTVADGASSTIQLAPTLNFSSGTVGPITVGNGSTLALSIGTNAATGVLRGVLTAPSISFTNPSSGKFDVGANALDLTNQSLSSVTALVKSGYANGTWTGNGITSSAAASDSSHLTALGVIVNSADGTGNGTPLYGNGGSLASSFEGISPSASDVLVKYTYYGDTNLDGKVDGSDYSRIDNTYEQEAFKNGVATQPISGWYNGDFNYDGVVDGSDYTLMDNAFNSQGAQFTAAVATAQIAGVSAVPEPTTLALLTLGAAGLLGRRRRHH